MLYVGVMLYTVYRVLYFNSAAKNSVLTRHSATLCFTFTCPSTAGVVGAPQMTSQPVSSISLCSPLPSGTWRLQVCPFPHVVFPPLFLSDVSSVRCKMVLARPDERKTCPYHCSLCHFTMVRRSSCGPIACWILAQTGNMVFV